MIGKLKNRLKNKKGFSMLESILATAIVSIGLVGAISLLSKTTRESMDIRDQVIAGLLAQEGAEIVRNKRDNNWGDDDPSTDSFDGIIDGASACIDMNLADGEDVDNCSGDFRLYLDGNNYYVADSSGTIGTKFERRVNITHAADGSYVDVLSMVTWGGSWPAAVTDCVAANKCAYVSTVLRKWGG